MNRIKVKSWWTYEKGRWSEKEGKYIDKTISPVYTKDLEIGFKKVNGKDILKFIGGPTGFESYYLEDLEGDTLDHDGDFCICGGNINSWAKCSVKSKDIHNAIKWRKK